MIHHRPSTQRIRALGTTGRTSREEEVSLSDRSSQEKIRDHGDLSLLGYCSKYSPPRVLPSSKRERVPHAMSAPAATLGIEFGVQGHRLSNRTREQKTVTFDMSTARQKRGQPKSRSQISRLISRHVAKAAERIDIHTPSGSAIERVSHMSRSDRIANEAKLSEVLAHSER